MYFFQIKEFFRKLRNNKTFKNGILFTFFSFLNNGISFLLLIILARFITPDGYGELNLFNTFIVLVSVVISLSSNGYISVCFFNKSKEDFQRVINSVFLITSVVFLILLFFQVIFMGHLEKLLGLQGKYQFAGLWICFFQLFNTVNLDIWRLEEKPVKYGIYSISVALMNLVLTLIFVISFDQGWLGRLYAQFIVAVLFFLISLVFLIKRQFLVWIKPGIGLVKESLLFGLPLVPHLASSWIRQGLDRYIVNNYHTVADVGLFSYALNFANIILIVGTAFNASNSVFIFKTLSDSSGDVREHLLKHTKFMLLFFVLFTVVVYAASLLFIYQITPEYRGSMVYLFPLCVSMFFQAAYLLFVNYLFYFSKTKILMYITFSVSVLHLLLSFILTRYSIQFTAYISTLSSVLIFFLVLIYSLRLLKEKSESVTYGRSI
jgi:O-antigen/teichoic acid export membrane protein